MTRHDVEQQCREALQQNIPDKEALWKRIEANLPAQPAQQPAEEPPKRKISMVYRTIAAAACFVFVAGGLAVWGLSQTAKNARKTETARPSYSNNVDFAGEQAVQEQAAEAPAEEAEAYEPQGEAAAPAMDEQALDFAGDQLYDGTAKSEEAKRENKLTYAQLKVPQTTEIAAVTDRSKLKTGDSYFTEESVLENTFAIVKAEVLRGSQEESSGVMTYTLHVLESYSRGEGPGVTLTLSTSSPYLMEKGHVYYLPLHYDDSIPGDWELSYADAPQIECTQDGKILYHSGWATLLQRQSIPVVCEPQYDSDFFYDRMYLTDSTALEELLDVWASMQ
ncbi:MAG: hypothetical protein K5695_17625 [Oscillospiraceae bacterium]|nr:hypothetical protein [Oscillospiraceae bacterium]